MDTTREATTARIDYDGTTVYVGLSESGDRGRARAASALGASELPLTSGVVAADLPGGSATVAYEFSRLTGTGTQVALRPVDPLVVPRLAGHLEEALGVEATVLQATAGATDAAPDHTLCPACEKQVMAGVSLAEHFRWAHPGVPAPAPTPVAPRAAAPTPAVTGRAPRTATDQVCAVCGRAVMAGVSMDEHVRRAHPEAAAVGAPSTPVAAAVVPVPAPAAPTTPAPAPPSPESAVVQEASAVAELAALKATMAEEAARQRARYTGWKPLVIWYLAWSVLIGIGGLSALGGGNVGTFLICAALSGGAGWYAWYLYNGGRYRVWFFIW